MRQNQHLSDAAATTLLEPVPPHLVESLTVDTLPVSSPHFDPECTELCRYCLALTQTLSVPGFAAETEKYLIAV
ncbi:TPA: hypothetical protein N3A47_002258 [Salmonella enterica subsp. houtenae serovar 47:z36:-]|nr:hypothetical protein [Salmonella enterica subsp. houtenae serovar 47:z36:-]